VEEIFPTLASGATLILAPRDVLASIPDLHRLLRDKEITNVTLPPVVLQVLSPEDLPALRTILSAGEACTREVFERWSPGRRFFNGYGPTESTVGPTLHEVDHLAEDSFSAPLGRPLANTQIYLLDNYLQPVPVGFPGEICVGGVGVARGYLNRPELTAEKFIRLSKIVSSSGSLVVKLVEETEGRQDDETIRLYKTGDLGRWLPDGTLEYLGRADQQVKLRGFRIELGEIEAALLAHPRIRAAAAMIHEAPAPEAGEGGPAGEAAKRLVAYLVTGPATPEASQPLPGGAAGLVQENAPVGEVMTDGEAGPSDSELRAFLRRTLPEYMLPSAFVWLPALPVTPNGKVDRRSLAARPLAAARPRGEDAAYVPPTGEAEYTLAAIFAQVLGVEAVGAHDNFFERGGDSILSIQVVARAAQAGLVFTPRQLFQHPTVAGLAALAGTATVAPAEQGLVTGPLPLTPIQRWFFAHHIHAPHHWNTSMLLETWPGLDPALLAQSLQALLAHHDALRLRFTPTPQGWQAHLAGLEDPLPFTHLDLAGVAEEEQRAAIEQAAAGLQASLDLTHGPLLRVAYFHLGAGRSGRVLLMFHHLVFDGVTWRIFFEDFARVYHQLWAGEDVQLPPKTISFKRWAEQLEAYAQTPAVQAERDYWLAQGDAGLAGLPLDYPDGANTYGTAAVVSVALSQSETQALLQAGEPVQAVLLACLGRVLGRWTGSEKLRVELEGHGREAIGEELDVSRTMGWFTSAYPLVLDLREARSPAEALEAVKVHLAGLPQKGLGYGLLRYLGAGGSGLEAQAAPEVNFNYLGQFGPGQAGAGGELPADWLPARQAGEHPGPEQDPRNERGAKLYVIGIVAEGELALHWSYSREQYDQATIERLAQSCLDAVREFIDINPGRKDAR
jgi:non-ribosomal peptide synthase protein (TIGR01720 family)